MPAKNAPAARETTNSPPRPTKAIKTSASSSQQVMDESAGQNKHPSPSELPPRSPTRSTASSESATGSAESRHSQPRKDTLRKSLVPGGATGAPVRGATMAGLPLMHGPEAAKEAEKVEPGWNERDKVRARRGAIAAQGTGGALTPKVELPGLETYAGMSRSTMYNEVHRRWNAGLIPADDDYQGENEDKGAYRTAELEERVKEWLAEMDGETGFEALEQAEDAHAARRVSER